MGSANDRGFRILALDGGGAKGIYSLGFLLQLERHLCNGPLCNTFDLIYGTSTGAIIASLIGLGHTIEGAIKLYLDIIPTVMPLRTAELRSAALQKHATSIFQDKTFDLFKTRIAIVSTNYDFNRPTIFKSHVEQVYSMQQSFKPGLGCTIADATIASAAATPFFCKRVVQTSQGSMTLIDGGFVANNPSLLALTDATNSLARPRSDIRLLSLGVGQYKRSMPPMGLWQKIQYKILEQNFPIDILDTALSAAANSTEQLVRLLFPDIRYLRVDDAYVDKGFETNLLEHNESKLQLMLSHGTSSFGSRQSAVEALF